MGIVDRLRHLELARRMTATDSSPGDRALLTWYRWFHLVFGAVAVVSVVACWLDTSSTRHPLLASCVVAGLVGWFILRGQWKPSRSNRDILGYFVIQLLLLVVGIRIAPPVAMNLFAAYWQSFGYFNFAPSLVWALLLTLAVQWSFRMWSFSSFAELPSHAGNLVTVLLILIVSGMMARYMELFSQQADRNANLVKELRETQDQLVRSEREAGVQAERRRIAAEIHDTIAQQFTSIVTNLEASEARLATNPQASLDHLRAARDSAREGIQDARSLVQALQPNVLEGRTLAEALEQVCRDENGRAAATVSFSTSGTPQSLERVREAILVRALQESLTNIRKHAHATNAESSLTWLDDEVILDIQDDGQGFDLTSLPLFSGGHHFGLESMRQRVEHAGGDLTIESKPGEGTSIAISFPSIPAPEDRHDNR